MKRKLFLGLCFLAYFVSAQFNGEDVEFFVGEGENTAFMIIDFKDETDDRSYAWGFKFDEENDLTFADMLIAIDEAEPNFSHQTGYGGAFLNDVIFNSHSGLEGQPDWWNAWSGDSSDNMNMSGGISESLVDGRWYGASYGFSNPAPEHPHEPLPAYHSLWFSSNEINNWFGNGANQSIVIVDFGTDTEGTFDSFAFGIKYDEEMISAEEALQILQNEVFSFDHQINENELVGISWNGFQGISDVENPWKFYTGTDLSNWKTATDLLNTQLENNEWLGLSFGNRRPITPSDQSEQLNLIDAVQSKTKIYPNPTTDFFYIDANDVSKVEIYDFNGKMLRVIDSLTHRISVQDLAQGVYFVKIYFLNKIETKKLMVK